MDTLNSRNITRTAGYLAVVTLLVLLGSTWPAEAALQNITINKPLFGSYTTTGLPVTNYRQVALTLNPPAGSATMSFRNESEAWSTPEPVATSRQWVLSTPDAEKSVSVQFKDSLNAIIGTFSDKTRLDYIIDTSYSTPMGSNNYANTTYTNLNTSSNSVAVQPADQKVVVVGTEDKGGGNSFLRVIRYNTDGTPDTTFGAGSGTVWYGNPTGAYSGNAVAIQPDGKIVVVGTYQAGGRLGMWLLRLTDSGALDPDFNTAGGLGGGYLIKTSLGVNTTGNAVTLDTSNPLNVKIIVAGTYDNGGTSDTSPWVLRYNFDGTPDTTFNETGEVIISSSIAGPHVGNAVARDASGNIIIVGTYNASGSYVWATRLTSGGQLDKGFVNPGAPPPATPGSVFYGNSGSQNAGNAVAINSTTGKINIVGTWDWTGGNTDIWLMQLNSDGTPDPNFKPNKTGVPPGSVALGGSGADIGSAVAIQADGKILIAGTYDNGGVGGTSLLVERINADSSYDTDFNRGNPAYSYGMNGFFAAKAVALQSDNKIIVAGYGFVSTGTGRFAINYSTMFSMRLFDHMWPLTVTTVGSGSVAAIPGDLIWVGSTGIGTYLPGTLVNLHATTLNGAVFTGWGGNAGCSGLGDCTVTMDAIRFVSANFTPVFALTVSVTGIGTVTSSVPASTISCNSTTGTGCSATLLNGTSVTLTTFPRPWYTISGFWSGGSCSGSITTDCTFVMGQNRTVNATFISGSNARVVGFGDHPTLAEAYSVANGSGPTAIIQAKDSTQVVFQEAPLRFNLPVIVTLQGGKGSDFSAPAVGYTSVIGPMNVSNGRLNASNLKVKQP